VAHGLLMPAYDPSYESYKLTRAAVAFVEIQKGNGSK
jgi:hypothetical protein